MHKFCRFSRMRSVDVSYAIILPPPHSIARYYVLNVCPSVRLSVGHYSSLLGANIIRHSIALNLCFLCNQGSLNQGCSVRRKTCHVSDHHDSSIRANGASKASSE